jgi:hypothetical protein
MALILMVMIMMKRLIQNCYAVPNAQDSCNVSAPKEIATHRSSLKLIPYFNSHLHVVNECLCVSYNVLTRVGLQKEFALRVPRTPIIVGIRHPILFFQSFWNMLADNNNRRFSNKSPYDFTEHCAENDRSCSYECKGPNALLCLHRSRFHLWLARSGKTLLTNTERELLAPDDKDGGMKLTNRNMTNPLFVYEISQLKHDYLWDELALLLKVPNIPHDIYKGNKDDRKPSPNRIDICDRQYDDFRAMIMPHAYNMSKWLCDYFVPRAKDESKSDVIIAKSDVFCETVKSYELDPCNRLVRMDNGVYLIPPDSSMSRNSSNKIVLK